MTPPATPTAPAAVNAIATGPAATMPPGISSSVPNGRRHRPRACQRRRRVGAAELLCAFRRFFHGLGRLGAQAGGDMFAKHLLPGFFRERRLDVRAFVAEIERSARQARSALSRSKNNPVTTFVCAASGARFMRPPCRTELASTVLATHAGCINVPGQDTNGNLYTIDGTPQHCWDAMQLAHRRISQLAWNIYVPELI